MSAGLGLTSSTPLIAVERRAALLPAYTAATIVAGIAVLVLVTAFGTLAGPIAVPMVAETWARPASAGPRTLVLPKAKLLLSLVCRHRSFDRP